MIKPASSGAKEQAVDRIENRRSTGRDFRRIPSTIKRYPVKPHSSKPQDLTKIANFLAKNNLNVSALKALTRLKALLLRENISVKEFENDLKLLKTYKITLLDIISLIKNTEALKAKYGKPYSAIVEDYESKLEKVARATTSLKEMEDEERDLEAKISNLRDLEALQSVLSQNGVSAEAITEYIEQYKRFVQFGLDVNTVKIIAEELKRLRLDPKEAGKIVGSWLTKNRNISEALLRAESELEAAKKEEALGIARIKSLDRKAEEAQKKIDSLESYYVRRSESLESEYETREHALHLRVGEERSRAEAELFDILRDRDKLRSENLTLKEEVEAIRKEVELARSISTIIRDPTALSSSQLDTLVTEFSKARETRRREEIGSSSSSERLIEARRTLVSALRDLPSLQKNTENQS
jgi:hypothetical protein